MTKSFFPGIQEGERILYFVKPHVGMKYFIFGGVFLASVFIIFASQLAVVTLSPNLAIQMFFLVISILVSAAIVWWVHVLHEGQEVYITDRRVVRFVPTTPFHTSTRSLFWDQAVKLKTYYKNPILQRFLGVGSITVNAKDAADDVDIHHAIYHHDLANYIDKIMYTFHNSPSDIGNIREFVPRPRGQRY